MKFLLVLVVGLCFGHVSVASVEENHAQKKTYIVHMAKSQMPASFGDDHTQWYHSSLKSVSDSAEMHYTYNNAVHGFSGRLTLDEAQSMKKQPGVVAVLEDVKYELHTTRTPEFLGLYESAELFPGSDASDIIIGMMDTGVWPESKSFNDSGMGPVPKSWKGVCENGTNFNSSDCNRKLIGARYYSKGYEAVFGPINQTQESKSPRDDIGHGTHTTTTAGGSSVVGANLFGYASGTARGMASSARVAMYKVCWLRGCFSSDILAGMDQAIDEEVNVISISLGFFFAQPYYLDPIAIGAYAAMEQGIFVSCAAGNEGPYSFSVVNVAPWFTTVGAGTLDRDFPADVSLGNGMKFSDGTSLYKGLSLPKKLLPLVYAGNASKSPDGGFCASGSLIPEKVRGKIVLCNGGFFSRIEAGVAVKEAGGLGMVLVNEEADATEVLAVADLLPATMVGPTSGAKIKSYLFSDPNPRATIIFKGTELGIQPSPVVAGFTSRGPNPVTPQLLKPDLLAPGVNIIAAWTGRVGPTELASDVRRVAFNIISGTSMATPHVSGLAALLKGAHLQWSPAAIRSALMTTAYTTYKNGHPLLDSINEMPATPFDYGAGHVDPVKALDPGLIYDLNASDYLSFLCAINYTTSEISVLTRRNFTCDPEVEYSVTNLNYPSFAVALKSGGNASTVVKYTRTVTNVGGVAATYNASVNMKNETVKVLVQPDSLSFSQLNERQSYTVTFTAGSLPSNSFIYGSITWSDGKHVVGSPIAISWF
ncbi:hypothetical protein RHGRI_023338 [Rhododendron griersonianum]|uniref:Subtilisin-like protease SBT1.7 n=1 Tax=Rhododendron griersonianum TaxID=479676 RepID=A0AAV6J8M4_9ERIC|nr:hypothetical protein RHGRI_023338 [Rhododendron griersonianum]